MHHFLERFQVSVMHVCLHAIGSRPLVHFRSVAVGLKAGGLQSLVEPDERMYDHIQPRLIDFKWLGQQCGF